MKPYAGVGFKAITEALHATQSHALLFDQAILPASSKAQIRDAKVAEVFPVMQPTPESSPSLRAVDTQDSGTEGFLTAIIRSLDELNATIQGVDLKSSRGYYLY
jgi:hypothetical protein